MAGADVDGGGPSGRGFPVAAAKGESTGRADVLAGRVACLPGVGVGGEGTAAAGRAMRGGTLTGRALCATISMAKAGGASGCCDSTLRPAKQAAKRRWATSDPIQAAGVRGGASGIGAARVMNRGIQKVTRTPAQRLKGCPGLRKRLSDMAGKTSSGSPNTPAVSYLVFRMLLALRNSSR